MANEVVKTVVSIVVGFGKMSLAEKKDALVAELNKEIASTSSTWVKIRDTTYITLVNYGNEYIVNKVNGWIS